jgi:hypothetical protein
MCLAAEGPVAMAGCQTLALCVGSPGTFKNIKSFAVMCRVLSRLSNCYGTITLHITARQYGEVVLPDASTGQSHGTLDKNLSRCEKSMACVFAVKVQSFVGFTSVALQSC